MRHVTPQVSKDDEKIVSGIGEQERHVAPHISTRNIENSFILRAARTWYHALTSHLFGNGGGQACTDGL